jgi:hypothetical protein
MLVVPQVMVFLALFMVLLCTIAGAWLARAVPVDREAHRELFTLGRLEPYRRTPFLRIKYLLPWTPKPDLAGCHRSAGFALGLARVSATAAVLGLLGASTYGIWLAWA